MGKVRQTDALGNATSYTYDNTNRVLTATDALNNETSYAYDSLGRLQTTTDARGTITQNIYDAVGNLLTVSDGEHSYSYTYNNLNQNVTTIFNFDAQTAVFNYAYDAVGRQTESSLTLNSTQTRVNQATFDFLGNATKIKQTGSAIDEIFAEFDYNANGLLTSTRRYEVDADDVATSIANSIYEYNANNAVTSITHNNSSGTEIVKHSYTYDSTNNIVEYLNSLDGNTTYDYDFLGQLISADYANTGIPDESYTYDENGNRVVANGSTYTTSTNNELTSDSSYTYTYDDEGNRISKTNSTHRELYEWDYRNRLTKVTQQTYNAETETWETTQTIEYTYDYNNVWIRKVVGNDKTIFIPENYQTVAQIDNGAVSHHYLWTPNQQDKLLADVTTEDILWALTDHLGSIRDVVGTTTNTHIIYDAYGNIISCKNSEGETISNPILFGYTGKPFDTDTQLQNNINRWYDASIGRWLSTDPIGFEGNDTNLYRYVSNTPNLSLDYNGFIEKPDGMILSVPNKNLPIFETIVLKSTETIFPKHSEDWSAFSCYNIKYTYKIQSVSSIDYSECNFFLDIMHPAYRSVFMKKSKQYIEQLSSLILPLKQNCSTKEECKNQKNVEGGDNTQQVMQILTFTMRDDLKIYVTLKVQVLFNTTMYYEGQVGDCC